MSKSIYIHSLSNISRLRNIYKFILTGHKLQFKLICPSCDIGKMIKTKELFQHFLQRVLGKFPHLYIPTHRSAIYIAPLCTYI